MRSLGKPAAGLRLERMRDSAQWAGERFVNVHPILPGLRDPSVPMPSLKEFICGGERRAPQRALPSLDPLQSWARPPASGLRATWLGHSTMLLEIDGLRVLTDPVWGQRGSPSQLAGPKRFQPVPVQAARLPPLDLVVVSHDHYDHLDYPTIRELARHGRAVRHLARRGRAPRSLGRCPRSASPSSTGGKRTACPGRTEVTAAPSQHFSGPHAQEPQHHAVVVDGRAHAATLASSSAATRA